MNAVFCVMVVASLVYLMIANPSEGISAAVAGATDAVTLSVQMLAVYALWLGVLGVMQRNGVTKFVTKLFRPVTKRLFKGENDEAHSLIAQNLAANFLGIGGAATPLGIRATALLQGEGEEATDHAVLLIVINACGVQLIPGTIIALRASAGSAAPSDIFLPTVISTAVTAAIGITLTLLTRRRK